MGKSLPAVRGIESTIRFYDFPKAIKIDSRNPFYFIFTKGSGKFQRLHEGTGKFLELASTFPNTFNIYFQNTFAILYEIHRVPY